MLDEQIQDFIIKGLIEDRNYFRNVIGNITPDHFDEGNKVIVKLIKNYFVKHSNVPTYDIIASNLRKLKDKLGEDTVVDIAKTLKGCKKIEVNNDDEWLLGETKEFVKTKAIEDLLIRGSEILENGSDDAKVECIYTDMQDIVGMSWNDDLGIEYDDLVQFDEVYDILEDVADRIPTGIKSLDDAIGGGVETNTSSLYVAAGGAGMGKCCTFENTIRVRNKTTGEIKEMPIGEFYEQRKKDKMSML